jgi:hypothetical protein
MATPVDFERQLPLLPLLLTVAVPSAPNDSASECGTDAVVTAPSGDIFPATTVVIVVIAVVDAVVVNNSDVRGKDSEADNSEADSGLHAVTGGDPTSEDAYGEVDATTDLVESTAPARSGRNANVALVDDRPAMPDTPRLPYDWWRVPAKLDSDGRWMLSENRTESPDFVPFSKPREVLTGTVVDC